MNEEWKTPANYFYDGRTLTGYLCFYKDYFVYKADSVTGSLVFQGIPYSEIEKIKETNTLAVIPNGLIIYTQGEKQYQFSMMNRSKIKNFLQSKIGRKA
ncbi:MAG: hypothetical protein PUF49_03535 [Firmicutes bacterium]|nr:hypothetical protein [Bacillota bacterium]